MGKMGREPLSILVEAKFPAPFLLSDLLPSNIASSTFPSFGTIATATIAAQLVYHCYFWYIIERRRQTMDLCALFGKQHRIYRFIDKNSF